MPCSSFRSVHEFGVESAPGVGTSRLGRPGFGLHKSPSTSDIFLGNLKGVGKRGPDVSRSDSNPVVISRLKGVFATVKDTLYTDPFYIPYMYIYIHK